MQLPTWLRRIAGRTLQVWYDPAYRLPIPSLEARTGLEPRRADLVAWYLMHTRTIGRGDVRGPSRISFDDLALVHDAAYLERVHDPDELGRIFSADSVPVDTTLEGLRLACGGTLAAAREALRTDGPAVNLLGGFHHAGRAFGGGLCVFNDVAVAIAVLRREGLEGTVAVLDFDAHPPDGLADCRSEGTFLASISGSSWGALEGVDETVLAPGSRGPAYLEALDALLERIPKAALAFVIAGGDVLEGDRLGTLGLTLDDAGQRDLRVLRFLDGIPSVWLPGGGYGPHAWRTLAQTCGILSAGRIEPIPTEADPLRLEFSRVARLLGPAELQGGDDLDMSDVLADLGMKPAGPMRFLGYYSASGIELALERYGILGAARRLGYGRFRVVIDALDVGDRVRVFGSGKGEEHLLLEAVLERSHVAAAERLYIHWLTLRHPLSTFTDARPRLPGQEVPGLGLSREFFELMGRVALRLGLDGIGTRPAWFHVAFAGRHDFRFADPVHQGTFEALVRDLSGIPLLRATQAVSQGLVERDGRPYTWEPELMVAFTAEAPDYRSSVDAAREGTRFSVRSPATT